MSAPAMPEVPGVEHRFVALNGVRLHVAEAGEGPALLLLHGWPQHWWCWRHLIPPLAERFHVLAVDLRGWGWSDAPPGRYDKRTFAADVVALLDAEGLDRVQLMGHDWGGFTAFLVALEHPERVERLLNLDIPPPWLPSLSPRRLLAPLLSSYMVAVGTPGLGPRLMTSSNRFIRAIIRGGSARGRWSTQELDAYASVLRQEARAQASSACYRTFLTRELPGLTRGGHRPQDLAVETLLVMGARSLLTRVLDPQPTPVMRVAHIEGAGHFLPEEAPAEVLELAREFLVSA